jgi:hypothetical protein
MLGSSCRASRAVKEAQALSLCKASVFFGAQVPRGREARSGESGERSSQSPRAHGGGTHLGLCQNASPFAGRCGPRDLRGGARLVREGQTTRCGQHAREVPPLVALFARQTRCAVPVRGGASPVETSARTFTRVGPVHAGHASSEACVARLVSPRPSPRGGGRRRRRGEGRHLPAQNEDAKRLAVSARASHGLQKSAERPRAQRSASPVSSGSKAQSGHGARGREPDHRGRSGAQAQEHVAGKRGAWHLGSAILIT